MLELLVLVAMGQCVDDVFLAPPEMPHAGQFRICIYGGRPRRACDLDDWILR